MGAETAAYYALYAALAGTAVSAYGVIEQGRAERKQAAFDSKVQENNAISEGYAAIQEQQAAAREAQQLRDDRLRVLSSQRAAAAHSGLMISGSVIDVMSDSAIESEQEIYQTVYRGQIGSYNAGQRAANLRAQAGLTRSAGRNAWRSALVGAGGTILSGASSAGFGYANFRRS